MQVILLILSIMCILIIFSKKDTQKEYMVEVSTTKNEHSVEETLPRQATKTETIFVLTILGCVLVCSCIVCILCILIVIPMIGNSKLLDQEQ